MSEEAKEETGEEEKEEKEDEEKKKKKKPGKRLSKIPRDILFTPGGLILIFVAIGIEILDFLIPPSGVDLIIEIIPEVIFAFFLKIIAGVSFSAMIVPFILERLDFLGIFPSLLKFFI